MIQMMGESYLTEKEASSRYGYSSSWFNKARAQGYGPHYIQVREHGRILYHLEETDKWFKRKIEESE